MSRFSPKRPPLVRLLSGLGPPPPPRRCLSELEFSELEYGGHRRGSAGGAAMAVRDAGRATG